MFYLANSSYFHNKYGVVDTKDGIIEYITKPELTNYVSSGIQIQTEGYSFDTEFERLNNKMTYKLYRECIRDNAQDFLKTHTLPMYDLDLLNRGLYRTGVSRTIDYNEKKGFYILIFELQSLNSNDKYYGIAVVSDEGFKACESIYMCDLYRFNRYPCGSGFMHQSVDCKDYGLIDDNLYFRLHSSANNTITFISIPDFNTIVIKEG